MSKVEQCGATLTVYGALTKMEQWNNEPLCTRISFELRHDG
jgi:hypothetical protein